MKDATPRFLGVRHSARSLTLEALLRSHAVDTFVQDALDSLFQRCDLSANDRRLATHLALGVVRRRGTLDHLLRSLITRSAREVDDWLWDVLRLGAFQLAFLDQVPEHAAIHETVELVGQFGAPRAKGFVNGVLRSFQRLLTPETIDLPTAGAMPLAPGSYRVLARSVLPDPAAAPVDYLAAGLSYPRWLMHRWLDRWGWDESLRLAFWFNATPSLSLRVNTLAVDRPTFAAALERAGIALELDPHPQGVRLLGTTSIPSVPGFGEGWFTVQDTSAMAVASALAPLPGQRVLDLCAAPGGKTTHLAELMGDRGSIVACDVDDNRLRLVVESCQRLKIGIVETLLLDRESTEPPIGPFDAALVDVPCSNTGVLGRRPEARWRLRPETLARLVPLQTKLLIQALERVRPDGVVVYSTCSIEPDENERLVQNVVRAMKGVVLEAESHPSPGRPGDGGYWAKLRRAH